MAVRWITIASLPVMFLIGAMATIRPTSAFAAVALVLLAGTALARYRPDHRSVYRTVGLQPDWIVMLLPIVVTIRPFSPRASLLITGLLVAAAFIRKPDGRFPIQAGPLLLLFAAAAIVFSRPEFISEFITFALISGLALRLAVTVDARKIITSLVDGCGLYLVANVLAHAAGLPSPAAEFRVGAIVQSTGFVRTFYPFASSLNTAPTIASIYVVAVIFLILEPGWLRRALRLICLVAAAMVLVFTGTRAPIAVAAALSIIVICLPFSVRWIGQAVTIFAAVSAFVLPAVIVSTQSAIAPLLSLAPGRVSNAQSIASIEGRDYVWEVSIRFWFDRFSDFPHSLLGFGVNGHFRSGASHLYSDKFKLLTSTPELVTMHNSFLQQLFDGGIVGFALMLAAAFWASARLSKRRNDWGNAGLSAIVAMAALLLNGMTEGALAPGLVQDSLFLWVILVGVACQASGTRLTRLTTGHDTGGAQAATSSRTL